MEGTKRRAANSLGMFDLLKGVGMLTIVFAHTGELYPMGDASHINPLTFCMFAYRESLMAAFYIASGYGFRKRSISKCIHQQLKSLLFSLFIQDAQHFRFYVSAVRLHNFNRFPDRKFVSLLYPAQSVFDLPDNAKISILFIVCVAVIDLCRLIRFPKEKSGRKLAVSTV
mgnify:CR=1 FL=1